MVLPLVFRTLYARIALTFLFLLILLSLSLLLAFSYSWEHIEDESKQYLYWNLADKIAQRVEPLITPTIDHQGLANAVFEFSVINPGLRFYLLDKHGNAKSFVPGVGTKEIHQVSVGPIRQFLNAKDGAVPILGDDPQSKSRKVVFSAAQIRISGQSGYLYVVLRSSSERRLLAVLGQSKILKRLVQAFGVAVFVVALVGLLVFGFVTKRFYLLTKVVERIGSGELSARVDIVNNDEISILGQTINHMAQTLEGNIVDLEQKDTIRRELVANISHDLRGPLTSIRGFAETLENVGGVGDDHIRSECISGISSNVVYLDRLISDLFDLSKFEAGQFELKVESFCIVELAKEVRKQCIGVAKCKNLDIELIIDNDMLNVSADPKLVFRVLLNLLENAINYSGSKDALKIKLQRLSDYVHVSVVDSGVGIDHEEQSKIFDRFYRVEKHRSKVSGGTGLGLAIVKQILLLHGEEISLESEPGCGSKFGFKLPINSESS